MIGTPSIHSVWGFPAAPSLGRAARPKAPEPKSDDTYHKSRCQDTGYLGNILAGQHVL